MGLPKEEVESWGLPITKIVEKEKTIPKKVVSAEVTLASSFADALYKEA
jgi:hypothetical protein